ncbi:MAG: hypothetical protein MJ252_14340 [archaeon]|nr:hypothetical protein [archaeon]
MLESVENIYSTFEEMKKNETYYSKELITKVRQILHSLEFESCHIAICRNGGMMAFVKKSQFFIMDQGNPIRDNIRVFFQDGTKEKRIRFKADEKDKQVVFFDFTDEEKLFVVMSNGQIYKIDIFNKKVLPKAKSNVFEGDSIISAKLFGKGFVCLTRNGNFVLTKNFSESNSAVVFFPMGPLLRCDEIEDYLFIPENVSNSKKIELIVTNPNGNGLIHVIEQPNNTFQCLPDQIQGVSYIQNDTMEPYIINSSGREEYVKGDIGKVNAFVMSPNKRKIALYRKETGSFFIINSNLGEIQKRVGIFQLPEDVRDNSTREELSQIISSPLNYQLLFCGNDSLCLAGKKYILLSMEGSTKTLFFKMTKRNKTLDPNEKVLHCISEIDGLRILTKEGIFFISQVPEDLYKSTYTFSEDNAKKLMKAYSSAEARDAKCDDEIRKIIDSDELPTAVKTLQNAAAGLWRTKEQLFMLKAAKHGKNFVEKGDYNFNMFMDVCKDIRIVNNLHMSDTPRYITFFEYKKMNMDDLIDKLLRNQDFYLAYQICSYLKRNPKKVYQKLAIAQMKSMPDSVTPKDEEKIFERIQKKLEGVPNISYIQLAKKAFKYGKTEIGIKFLDQEKSILTKIPQYIELKNWNKALQLAFKTFDTNVLITVLDKIKKNQTIDEFCNIVVQDPNANSAAIEFLKRNHPNELETYLIAKANYEDLFFFALKKYFKGKSLDEKKRSLKEAKNYVEKINSVKGSSFDVKYYKQYLKDLENSIYMKTEFLKEEVIRPSEQTPFDSSNYEIFKTAIKKEKLGKVEQKIKGLDISKRKLNIMRLRSYAEMNQFEAIDTMFNKGDFKKFDLTHLNFAEIYIEYGRKDKAAEVLKKITDSDYFDYKVEQLKIMERFEDALEAIISDKNCDKEIKAQLVDEILSTHGDLKKKADEFCNKYKVQL